MVGRARRLIATAPGAGALAVAGAALAAAPASAFHFTKYQGGPAVATGTTASFSGGALSFKSGGAVVASCTGSTWSTVTAAGSAGATGVASQLNLNSGSYTGCKTGGQTIFLTVPTGQIVPVAVLSSPPNSFSGVLTGGLTVRCGSSTSSPATYSATGGSIPLVLTDSTSGFMIAFDSSQQLTKSGSGCPSLAATISLAGTEQLSLLGGTAVSASNDLWLNAN